ncbi:MAG TPA: hypothetical protein VGG61_11015 [Gemmataceae bacterium]|jgi:hypothetical protein
MKHPLIVLGLALSLSAGFSAADQPPENPLAGKRFLSVEKLPGGKTPEGGIGVKHWELQFKDTTYRWSYHNDVSGDVVRGGGYELDAKTGVLSFKGNVKIEASFDVKTGVLTWDKQKYKMENSDK